MNAHMFVALAAVTGCTTSAFAQFGVRMADTSSLGSPIVVNGTLFQSTAAGAGNVSPSPEAIAASSANQWLEYDSYIAIQHGPAPLAAPDFPQPIETPVSIGNPFGTSGQVGAVWFMDPQGLMPTYETATNTLFGNAHAAFLGRFGFRSTSGSFPTGSLALGPSGVVIDIRDSSTVQAGPGSTDSLLLRFTSLNSTVQQGMDGADNMLYTMNTAYQLRLVSWSAGPVGSGTARWIGYDMYVVQVPAPSSALVLGGLPILSRRRRR